MTHSRHEPKHIPGWVGVDEAGRGPLAGPVVAAAVLIPDGVRLLGIDDSKRLDPEAREHAAEHIRETCFFGIGFADHREIDSTDILRATYSAMSRAVESLGARYHGLLIDGNLIPPQLTGPIGAIVRGDGHISCIAAASILAKTCRDAWMRDAAKRYPEYGFDAHFGYATPQHLQALREHGPCEIHRKTFRPIRDGIVQRCLALAD